MTPDRSPRAFRVLLSAGLIGLILACTPTANAQPSTAGAGDGALVNHQLLAIGAGAVLGVVAFNVLAAPLGTVPFAGGVLDAVPTSVALGSRLIAVTAATAGAVGATWIYDHATGHQTNYAYLLTLGGGAFAGVAVGNLLASGTFGYPPYYLGAGIANAAGPLASAAAQAASRVYVIGAAALGTFAADWLYRR